LVSTAWSLVVPTAEGQALIVIDGVVERELAIRLAAQAWLDAQRADGIEAWSQKDLATFRFGTERIPLMDVQRGIRKPAGMAAALTMRTVYRRAGADRPYEDQIGIDGLLRYKLRGDVRGEAENLALRAAMERHLPLIWFYGFADGVYAANYPVYLIAEETEQRQFVVALGEDQRMVDVGHEADPILRAYVERTTLQRMHQPAFRAGVMRAYATRCAICSIRHSALLDAAHIIPDADAAGSPETSNGLALCKIHHSAFDSNILGIQPDLTIQVRSDVLTEIDGPMLRYGIQAHHGQKLMVVPTARRDKPDPDRLGQRYAEFLTAR
jgi:putative restriction endonuclease